MAHEDLRHYIDQTIADLLAKKTALEQSIATAKAFRRSLDDPELAEKLAETFSSRVSRAPASETNGHRHADSRTNFDRIRDFLRAQGNAPQTTRAILQATSLPRGSVANVLHKTHASAFEKHPVEGNEKLKAWTLKEG